MDFTRCLMCFVCVLLMCYPESTLTAENTWIEVEYSIVEELPPSTVVGNLSASVRFTDQGGAGQGSLQFSFLPQSTQFQQYFTIVGKHGLLKTNAIIDRDETCAQSMQCDMLLDVGVLSPNRDFTIMKVTVHVVDINDNAPAFPKDTIELSISETALPGVSFVLPTAWDPDSGKYGVQSYKLSTRTDKFSLNVSYGSDGTVDIRLILRQKLDREVEPSHTLEVVATDGGTPSLSGTVTVKIKVMDANDNSPQFEQPSYEITVREDVEVGEVILKVRASDPDHGANSQIIYSLASKTQNANSGVQVFTIRNNSGEILLNRRLDYETQTAYHLLVTVRDMGPDAIPTQARVVIYVADVNDHSPAITVNALTTTGNVEIPENSEPGVFVAHVSVEDSDSGPNGEVSCILSSGPFELQQIYKKVYKVVTTASFDSETQSAYILTLACHDNGNPVLRSSREINVSILDVNDHSPVFSQDVYSATLRENISLGQAVVWVNASDADSGQNARITFTIQGDPTNIFQINPSTGLIATNSALDYETMHNVKFTVVATDHGSPAVRSASATVVLNIVDVNDELPRFYHESYSFTVLENELPGTDVGTVAARDADSAPYNNIVYSLSTNDPDSDSFQIDTLTGTISTRKTLDREYKISHTLVVYASNPGFPHTTSSVAVTVLVADVNDNAPNILFPNNTSNTVNVPYGAPEGFVFTKIVSMDVDAGENGTLTYAIAKTSKEGLFTIDASSGAILIHSKELWSSGPELELLITVSDQGSPPKTSSADLYIIVNKSFAYPHGGGPHGGAAGAGAGSGGGTPRLNQNQTVLISLGIVTVLLVTILIVAIILVRRRRYKDEEGSAGSAGSNQNNFLKIQPAVKTTNPEYVDNDTLPESDSQESGVYSEESNDKGVKEVKFINNISGGILVKTFPEVPILRSQDKPDDVESGCYSVPRNTVLTGGSHPGQPFDRPQAKSLPEQRHHLVANGGEQKPWSLGVNEVEVQQLLSRMGRIPTDGRDSDTASGCSAEVSTTDSGRGPSEDGDTPPSYTPPTHGSDGNTDDGNQVFTPIADGVHVQQLRMAGRNSGACGRPPTGVRAPYHGGGPRPPGNDPITTTSSRTGVYPAKTEGQRPSYSHVTPEQGGRAKPCGRSYRETPNRRDCGRLHPNDHGGRRATSNERHLPGDQLTISGHPAFRGPQRAHTKLSAPHLGQYPESSNHLEPRTDPRKTGKMLIWERFRDYAGGRALAHVPETQTLSSLHETTTQDDMSDDGSTTSGSYVLDTDDFRQRPVVVNSKDSFV